MVSLYIIGLTKYLPILLIPEPSNKCYWSLSTSDIDKCKKCVLKDIIIIIWTCEVVLVYCICISKVDIKKNAL